MNECPEGQIRDRGSCIFPTIKSLIKNSSNCINPNLSDIKEGLNITLCDGSIGVGTLKLSSFFPDCKKDGEQDCVVTSTFKAANTSNISPSEIKNGKTIAGIKGDRRDVKQCRNSANTAYFDTSPTAPTIRLPGYINSFPGGNAVGMAWTHGLSLNDPIQLFCIGGTGTGLPGGQVNTGTTYYAVAAAASNIQFQAAPSSGALSVTGITGCTGTWIVATPGDGLATNEDTIDDLNGFSAMTIPPLNSPWGSEYICDQSNFTNVTGASPFAPSNTIPTNANQVWSQIWRDDLTGLLFTNLLYNAVPSTRDWYQLNDMCKGLDLLNGGSGGSGWRLPTQKELMQLYINGISKLSFAGGSTDRFFWSSTGVSWNVFHSWYANLGSGWAPTNSRDDTSFSTLCVR